LETAEYRQIESEVSTVGTGPATSSRGRTDAICACLLAFPTLAVFAILAASGAAALVSGLPFFCPAKDVTLTEAIAVHDSGEFVRQIAIGANANLRYDTWDVLKQGRHVRVTPLEAAVATRELYLFDLVMAYGASLTADNAPTLHCFAVQEHAAEIVAELGKRFAAPPSCSGIELPW
jgi:hypothetical protein